MDFFKYDLAFLLWKMKNPEYPQMTQITGV
jgi:hypothetical protein